MKLREHLKHLAKIAEENPNAMELQLVTSSDDEGNSFNPVHYIPSLGYYSLEDRKFNPDDPNANAICLN